MGPDGSSRSTHQLVLVSNNPYELRRFGGFGTRERMDTGLLGITTISVASTAEAAQLTALGLAGQLDRFGGYDTWTAPSIEIDADVPVATGHRRRVRAPRTPGPLLDPSGLPAGAARPARAAGLTRRRRGPGGHRDSARALEPRGPWRARRHLTFDATNRGGP